VQHDAVLSAALWHESKRADSDPRKHVADHRATTRKARMLDRSSRFCMGRMAICREHRAWLGIASLDYLKKARVCRRQLRASVFLRIIQVKTKGLRIAAKPLLIQQIGNKIFQRETNGFYCRFSASLPDQTAITPTGRGFHLSHLWQYYLEGLAIC